MTDLDPLAEFSVYADYESQVHLDHVPNRRSCWDVEVGADVSLSRLVELAHAHLADQHGRPATPPS